MLNVKGRAQNNFVNNLGTRYFRKMSSITCAHHKVGIVWTRAKKIPRIGQRIETFLKIKGTMLDQAEKDQSLTVEPGLSDEVFEESAVGSLRKKLEQVTRERDEARLKCMVKDRALWLWLCPTEDFDAALDSCVEMGLPREVKSAIMYALSPGCALPMLAGKHG